MEAIHTTVFAQGKNVRYSNEKVIVLSVTDTKVYYVRKNRPTALIQSDVHKMFTFNTKD